MEVDYDDRSEVRRELELKNIISPSQNHLYDKYNEVDDDTMDHTHEPAQGKQPWEDEINMDTRQQPRKKARRGNQRKQKHGASRRKTLYNKEQSAKDS